MIRVSGRDMRGSRYVRKWGTSDFSSPRVPSISVRLLVPPRFDTSPPCPLRCGGTCPPRPAARCATMPTHERKRPAIAERQFRDAMAQFATGVTIITAPATHGFVGFTANSFNSVSLDPPLVIWSLALRSRSLDAFEAAKYYAVNMLAYDQLDLARRFSRPHSDRFAGVPFRLGHAA